jgi:hypothetical protein
MQILNGLYRLRFPHLVEEQHGGGTLKSYIYWYLSFYKNVDLVGLYGSGPNDYRRYFSMEFDLKGKVLEHHSHYLAFYIYNLDTQNNIIFEGKILKNKKELRLKSFEEGESFNIWIDDVFDLVEVPAQL